MRRTNKAYRSRPPAQPQWGWNGVHRRQVLKTRSAELAEAIRLLSNRRSSPEGLIAELEECGDRFRGDLFQDEFGPTRAERAKALKLVIESLEQTQLAIDALSPAARGGVVAALAADLEPVDKGFVDSFDAFQYATHAFEALSLAAADAGRGFPSSGCPIDLESIDRLHALSDRAAALVRSLDTATEFDLLVRYAIKSECEAEEPDDALARVSGSISGFSKRVREELDRLSAAKGPDARMSLPLLVARLCAFWERETGQVVTVNPYKKTEYAGTPQSAAGLFVSKVVAVLAPSPTERAAGIEELGRTSTLHLESQLRLTPQAVHSAMRDYVKRLGSKPTPSSEALEPGAVATLTAAQTGKMHTL